MRDFSSGGFNNLSCRYLRLRSEGIVNVALGIHLRVEDARIEGDEWDVLAQPPHEVGVRREWSTEDDDVAILVSVLERRLARVLATAEENALLTGRTICVPDLAREVE